MKRSVDGQPRAGTENGLSKTHVLSLNDDCLHDTFGYLSFLDLCAMADVCTRFRENAKPYLAKPENADINLNSAYDAGGMHAICRVLRTMSVLAETVRVQSDYERVGKFENGIIELISRHCSDRTRIILKHFSLEDDLIEKLPFRIILQVERRNSTAAKLSAELEEIIQGVPQTLNVSALTGLEELSLNFGHEVDNEIFEKALENSPQLKKIELIYCRKIDDRILPLIAARVPQIESLQFSLVNVGISFGTNVMCLNRLNNLKTLAIDCKYEAISSAIIALAAANIQLEHLKIENPHIPDIDVFFDGISKFKTLKSLKLFGFGVGIDFRHVIQIAENFIDLTELQLSNSIELNADKLLQLIRINKKLQHFYYRKYPSENIYIDGNRQTELMKIADERCKKIHLKISESKYIGRRVMLPLLNNFVPFPIHSDVGLTLSIK